MRRPLLLVCVCLFVSIAFVMQVFGPPPWNSEAAVSAGEEVTFYGQVYQKEYRVSYGEEFVILYLQFESVSKEANASYQELNQFANHFSVNYPKPKIIFEIRMSDLPETADGRSYVPRLGEEIFVRGKWQEFVHATNPGEFDLADYYAIEGIYGSIEEGEIVAGSGKYWRLQEWLFRLRQKLLKNLYTAFEPKEASILAKMLLGDGSGLDKEIRELYQDNGIVHILSISGLHISMLGMGVYYLLRRCRCTVKGAAVCGGILIIMYGMLTGFGVSVCRAIGMYLIHMLGEIWGKTYDMLTAMGVLAIVLLLGNPRLVYHSGYLLSFASVCGVGLLAPILRVSFEALRAKPYDSMVRKVCKKRAQQVLNSFIISLSVTLFTLPIQFFFYYKVPVYSVLLNLLVIPFMSVVMIIGFVVMIFPGLQFLCPIESMIFAWFEWLCKAFECLPGHTWVTGRPHMWKLLVYYLVLLLLICGNRYLKEWAAKKCERSMKVYVSGEVVKEEGRNYIRSILKLFCRKYFRELVISGVLMVMVVLVGSRSYRDTQVVFLDVGQGDCICVLTKSGECYLFDGGSSNKAGVGEKIIIPFLLYNGVAKVDGIFVSHPDEDHTNGLEQLLTEEVIKVERLIFPKVLEAKKEFADLLVAAEENVYVEFVSRGDVFQKDDFTLVCLHPYEGMQSESNTYSACYFLETEGITVLLTGDVEEEGESLLINELRGRGIGKVDVLKVAHHGSRYSTSEEFMRQVDAGLAVISCGKNNLYGHPHEETLERLGADGSVILTTPECGAVVVEIREGGIVVDWMREESE